MVWDLIPDVKSLLEQLLVPLPEDLFLRTS